MRKICAILIGMVFSMAAHAVELRGMASVNITSDTAANAKNIAFDEARRQIIADSLRQYADADTLKSALAQAKTSELMNLISSSSIDGEKLSDTTYSANISMVVDAGAAREWLDNNAVQHWLPDESKQDVFVVNVNMSDGMQNWAELNQIARKEKIDLATKTMTADSAVLELPVSVRGKFTIAVREGGWRFANNDGVLRIWK
ncbi:MAG: hypothetical protein J6Q44_03355 [Alphaproteobacteria bacterium]|nr:hypothetical protein [Alphaproteobacteria bacterium]